MSTALFTAALQHHLSGELSEAEDFYRRAIENNPRHADSLHNLGVIAKDAGKNEIAIDLIRRAIALNGEVAAYHYNIALALRALGRLEDAEAHAQRATALKPDHIGARLVIADLLKQQGRLEDALACYEPIFEIDPINAQAHNNIGNVLTAMGRTDEASARYERALALDPRLAVAAVNLGNIARDRGRVDDAIALYRRALAINPDHAESHHNLGAALLSLGRADEALPHCLRAAELDPHSATTLQGLAVALLDAGKSGQALEVAQRALAIERSVANKSLCFECLRRQSRLRDGGELRERVIEAMSEPWGRPAALMPVALALLETNAALFDCMARANAAWPSRLSAGELFGETGLAAVASDRLLQTMLKSAVVADVDVERFLTLARTALLDLAGAIGANAIDGDALAFACALAQQCFINEFVFAPDDDEMARAKQLRETLEAALRTGEPAPPMWVAAVGAYVPLNSLGARDFLLGRTWPEPVAALIALQVREPMAERRLRDSIISLTVVEDDVSVRVRNQYETNPYPRWIRTAPAGIRTTIDAHIRHKFPHAAFRALGRKDIDVLVAGCGTGQQLVEMQHSISGALILAVDLSTASLAYAKRKAEELGLFGIEFAHADILALETLGRAFDVIECGGVLHHLADPFAGWRTLLSVLRPDGLMRVGLYSALARRDTAAAQEFVTSHGYARTADDIRRARQDILALPEGEPIRSVAASPDFFSISTCRDLLFHVQEHRFTLPQIAEFLLAENLRLIGFDLDANVLRRYGERFPDDRARTDLANWHEFEQLDPDTFAGMYQFWVQKRG